MEEKKRLLAYCGFYCGDCLGYTGVIADAAGEFKAVLERYRFDLTAENVFPEELKDYDAFREALGFMTGLRCTKTCREGEYDATSCEVRRCCRERGLYACHECDDFENCDKLRTVFGGLHADSCLKNLRAIREMGLEDWVTNGKRHHYWDEAGDRL
jgi:hypothetical protein